MDQILQWAAQESPNGSLKQYSMVSDSRLQKHLAVTGTNHGTGVYEATE